LNIAMRSSITQRLLGDGSLIHTLTHSHTPCDVKRISRSYWRNLYCNHPMTWYFWRHARGGARPGLVIVDTWRHNAHTASWDRFNSARRSVIDDLASPLTGPSGGFGRICKFAGAALESKPTLDGVSRTGYRWGGVRWSSR